MQLVTSTTLLHCYITIQVGELSYTNCAAECGSLGQNVKCKSTFCNKSCQCHKTRNTDILTRYQLAAWLHCERVSLHVKSSHFPFVPLSCSVGEWAPHGRSFTS